MITELETIGAALSPVKKESAVCVQLPSHLPVQRIFLHRLWKGGECWIVLSSEAGDVLGVLASGITLKLGEFVARVKFAGGATRCAYTENLFDVGFAMVTYSAAQWLTREIRTVLDLRSKVSAMLAGKEAV